MEATFTEKGYLCLGPNGRQILSERDGLDLIAACAEHGTNLLLIDAARLSEDFLRLRTGLAGAVMQKFAQYSIRVAIVLDRRQVQGKLKEYLAELNRGDMFHTYPTREEAEQWLLKGREA